MEDEDIKIIIWALEHYDKVVDTINELLNSYKKLQQENQQYKNAWEELKEDCREVEKANDYILYERLQQLEKKYNIGGK